MLITFLLTLIGTELLKPTDIVRKKHSSHPAGKKTDRKAPGDIASYLGAPVQERYGHNGESPTKGHRDD